ncbi:MAG: D-alanine--D-alanine ligase [Bacteroidales bacterium]|nr:D-alanine--D-alanine ligase [Candidatus Cryptobacteroides fimicaballi]
MAKYNRIAVIYGSDTSEWEISCRSGEFTAESIDDTVYEVYEIFARFGKWQLAAYRKKNSQRVAIEEKSRPDIDKSDFSVVLDGEKVNFDYAYIMQHGTPGENGLTQGYLQIIGIPFSSCDSFVSAVAFDKYSCKTYIRNLDCVKFAPDVFVRKGEDEEAFVAKVNSTLSYPVFVKPTAGGSSFGVTKVKKPEDLPAALQYAFSEGDTVIAEQGVEGRELTCAAYFDGSKVVTLPQVEITTENEYFDYDAKYNGKSNEICPAPVSETERQAIATATAGIYSMLGCKGLVRVDYILAKDGLYFLEINMIPGMTRASLVPRMVRTAGMKMSDFLSTVIENS